MNGRKKNKRGHAAAPAPMCRAPVDSFRVRGAVVFHISICASVSPDGLSELTDKTTQKVEWSEAREGNEAFMIAMKEGRHSECVFTSPLIYSKNH
ncbi:hypothetical protein EVAR_74889_1 [Eumeta japonica]|uniref:Uncharacterized protein n=1 Tax=Eumeta variegata TaxID=151549 RepID=A0A4C1Z4Q3_EUMVA|nr:hypothetical protein EVAR_74889_1 [Eumeta japonica]